MDNIPNDYQDDEGRTVRAVTAHKTGRQILPLCLRPLTEADRQDDKMLP